MGKGSHVTKFAAVLLQADAGYLVKNRKDKA